MLTFRISDMLEEELQSQNLIDYKRELLSIYQQIIPGKDNSTRMGTYHDRKETFRKEPRLVNSLSRLLIDAELVVESDRVMNHFYGGRQSIRERVSLSEKERRKLVDYIHSRLFGEMFFNKRYKISAEQKPRTRKFAKNFRRKNGSSQDASFDERNFQTRYGIEDITEETIEPLLELDDENFNTPEPIFATTFNERYGIRPIEILGK